MIHLYQRCVKYLALLARGDAFAIHADVSLPHVLRVEIPVSLHLYDTMLSRHFFDVHT